MNMLSVPYRLFSCFFQENNLRKAFIPFIGVRYPQYGLNTRKIMHWEKSVWVEVVYTFMYCNQIYRGSKGEGEMRRWNGRHSEQWTGRWWTDQNEAWLLRACLKCCWWLIIENSFEQYPGFEQSGLPFPRQRRDLPDRQRLFRQYRKPFHGQQRSGQWVGLRWHWHHPWNEEA